MESPFELPFKDLNDLDEMKTIYVKINTRHVVVGNCISEGSETVILNVYTSH